MLLLPNKAPSYGPSNGQHVRIALDSPTLVPGQTMIGKLSINGLSFMQSVAISLRGFSTASIVGKRRYQTARLVAGNAVPISQLEEHTFLQRQQILWERDDEDRRPETEMQTDLPFTFDVPLLEDADTTKGAPPLPLPPRLDIAGGGPGLQVRYTLEVKVKRSGMFNKSAKSSYELRFENPSEALPGQLVEQTTTGRSDLSYKSSSDAPPLQMEGSLTVPSFIELGHAQAIPFRLTFHLVSAGSDQPPPDGLMDSFKPTVMVTLARQMTTRPVFQKGGTECAFPTVIIQKGEHKAVSGSDSQRYLTEYVGTIPIPEGDQTTTARALSTRYFVLARIQESKLLAMPQELKIPIYITRVAGTGTDKKRG